MKVIEVSILLITYSTILLSIFVGLICYYKKIEKIETVFFSVSLLLLIISISSQQLFTENANSVTAANIFTLLSMVLLSLTTPFNVLAERKHKTSAIWKQLIIGLCIIIFTLTCLAYFFWDLEIMQYVVAIALAISVISSMLFIQQTKPLDNQKHMEKINRNFSIAVLILVPITIFISYTTSDQQSEHKIGFIIPIIFTLLAANKLLDDLKRLSLFNSNLIPQEQQFENFALSKREKEVAALLIAGKTYKTIAEELFISLPTVKTHASNIYKKCSVKNRHELTAAITA